MATLGHVCLRGQMAHCWRSTTVPLAYSPFEQLFGHPAKSLSAFPPLRILINWPGRHVAFMKPPEFKTCFPLEAWLPLKEQYSFVVIFPLFLTTIAPPDWGEQCKTMSIFVEHRWSVGQCVSGTASASYTSTSQKHQHVLLQDLHCLLHLKWNCNS